jgi:hypothetical protein
MTFADLFFFYSFFPMSPWLDYKRKTDRALWTEYQIESCYLFMFFSIRGGPFSLPLGQVGPERQPEKEMKILSVSSWI